MPIQDLRHKTVARLSIYRRVLKRLAAEGVTYVFSHELANLAGGTAAQVRRDLMGIGYEGKPTRGYDVARLAESIGFFLDHPEGTNVVLVGMGNVGRAVMAFLAGRRPKLSIVASFDSDPYKAGRLILGCPCHPMRELAEVVSEQRILVGIIAVPADAAQDVADRLVLAGVRGILNFAPGTLKVPRHVYLETLDITIALEKVAYFARQSVMEAVARA
jgi:redox-sensing transcriptional repressor